MHMKISNLLFNVGDALVQRIKNFFYASGFFFTILKQIIPYFSSKKMNKKVLIMQILFTGVDALNIIGLLSLALGATIIIQGYTLLAGLGMQNLTYDILKVIITVDLGPVLTAFIVTARSGTAMTTELGQMVVDHQIEAYIASGINPMKYLAVPRFIGVTVSVVLLNIYFNVFGLLGSYLVTQLFNPISINLYLANLLNTIGPVDILVSISKSFLFGAAIATVAMYYGFKVEKASTEIPQMAIKSVGMGFTMVIFIDVLITILYYVA